MGTKEKNLEWENRVLCSDESCIGVIGPDGRCKECGLVYKGELPASFNHGSSEEVVDETPPPVEASTADDAPSTDGDDEWERRTLCIDESCIGVVGPDGRCKECGKPYPK